jgi:hypothetical protein
MELLANGETGPAGHGFVTAGLMFAARNQRHDAVRAMRSAIRALKFAGEGHGEIVQMLDEEIEDLTSAIDLIEVRRDIAARDQAAWRANAPYRAVRQARLEAWAEREIRNAGRYRPGGM